MPTIKRMAFDLEIQMLDSRNSTNVWYQNPYVDKLLLLAIKLDTGEEHLIDLRTEEIPQDIIDLFEHPEVMCLAHNAAFDIRYLYHNYDLIVSNVWCTMSAERLLHLGQKGVSARLDSVLARRYGIEMDKSPRNRLAMGIVGDEEKEYAMKDVRYLFSLQEDQFNELSEVDMLEPMLVENAFTAIVSQIEYNGLPFRKDLYLEYIEQMQDLLNTAHTKIWDMLGYDYSYDLITGEVRGGLNLSSRQSALNGLESNADIYLADYKEATLIRYLFDEKDSRKRAIILLILEAKKWEKALTWGYDTMVNSHTGCIHQSINALGAATSRSSSSKPNGQQIAKEYYVVDFTEEGLKMKPSGIDMRKCFEAPEGFKWVSADYSQIELRLYGEIAGVQSVIDEYTRTDIKPDLHRQAASLIYRKPAEEITSFERQAGKPVNFGARTFGGGKDALMGAALQYGLLLEPDEAERMAHLIADPEGIAWGKRETQLAKERGYIATAAGYRRHITKAKTTVCRNTPIQGLAAAIMKLGAILFWEWILKNNYTEKVKIVSIVHDELNTLAADDIAEKTLANLIRCMEAAGNHYMTKIPCIVEGAVGQNWSETH